MARGQTMTWMPLFALFVIRASGAYQFQAVAGAAPLLAGAGYDYAQIGLLIGAYMAPGVLVTVPAGKLTQRIGDKAVLAGGLGLMLAGAALMAATDGFAWLLAGRVLSGIGGLAVLMLVIKMTADRYVGPYLSTATAAVITSWYAGFALSLVGSAWVATAGSPRLALIASGAPALLGLLMLPFVGEPKPVPSRAGESGAMPQGVTWRFIASAALCWTIMNIAFAILVAFLPAYFAAQGWDPVVAGTRASTLTWAAGLAAIPGGFIADRLLGRTRAVVLGAGLCALFSALLPPAAATPTLLVATGLTYALFPAALTAQVGEATPPAARGVVFGWYSGASYVGLTIFPWLAGALRDATSSASAPIFLAAGLLGSFLLAYAWFRAEARRPSAA